jgi:hypothetical protein
MSGMAVSSVHIGKTISATALSKGNFASRSNISQQVLHLPDILYLIQGGGHGDLTPRHEGVKIMMRSVQLPLA